jgi:hypothetical protein
VVVVTDASPVMAGVLVPRHVRLGVAGQARTVVAASTATRKASHVQDPLNHAVVAEQDATVNDATSKDNLAEARGASEAVAARSALTCVVAIVVWAPNAPQTVLEKLGFMGTSIETLQETNQ